VHVAEQNEKRNRSFETGERVSRMQLGYLSEMMVSIFEMSDFSRAFRPLFIVKQRLSR
jgi:hypothetical protein